MENFAENPQGQLISQSLEPLLALRHPDRQFCIGQNSGIYWRMTDQPLNGAVVPDWFYVPGVPPMLKGTYRGSYVMWQEKKSPFLALEFVSSSGFRERDDTPFEGKFWIYENAIKATYYGIFDTNTESLDLYHLVERKYQRVAENDRGRCAIPELGIELGIWIARYKDIEGPWLRCWDAHGNLLLNTDERLLLSEQRAEQEKQRAEQEKQLREQLLAKLRSMGIDPDTFTK